MQNVPATSNAIQYTHIQYTRSIASFIGSLRTYAMRRGNYSTQETKMVLTKHNFHLVHAVKTS